MSAGIASNLRWYAANGGFDPEQERHLLEIADAIDLTHARKIARGGVRREAVPQGVPSSGRGVAGHDGMGMLTR